MSEEILSNTVNNLVISEDDAGRRVDNYIASRLKGMPRSHLYRILRKGEVRINKGRVKPDYRLKSGDVLRIPPIRLATRTPTDKPADALCAWVRSAVIHEDERLMVLNKPAGLSVHGGSDTAWGIIEILRFIYPEYGRLELVHRLDRDTSGCLLVAKEPRMLRALHEGLRNDNVHKSYTALCQNQWHGQEKLVSMALRKYRNNSGERLVVLDREGKEARTRFIVKALYQDSSLMHVEPITGRTHQIRVHANAIGYPIAGDKKYGNWEFNRRMKKLGLKRLFLHASSLEMILPGQSKKIRFTAPLPDELSRVLAKLGQQQS